MLHSLEGFKGQINALAFSPDGKTLLTGDIDQSGKTQAQKNVAFRDAHSGKLLRTLDLQEDATSVAFSPGGKILAVGTAPAFVQLFDTESWKLLRQFGPNNQTHIKSLVWSPDGATVAAVYFQRHVSIFDVKTGKELRRIETHYRQSDIGPPAWSSDGKKIATTYFDVRIWDADSGTPLHRDDVYSRSAAWSPRGASLAVADAYGQIHILDGETGQRSRSWNAPISAYKVPPAWSPDGKLIATGATDNTVQVWAAASGRLVHTLKGHTAGVSDIAWSSDGKVIASSSGDKTVRLWDASSGKQIHSFDAGECIRLAWSPDGKSLASSTGVDVRTWDAATKQLQLRCAGLLLGWSADSNAVMTWEQNGQVRWWDRQTGEVLRKVKFPFMDYWPRLSPDRQFVAMNRGAALQIGDIASGEFRLTLVPLRAGQWLAVRPDGHYRGSPGVEKEIVYVVQTDAGQEVLSPDEFTEKYGWKNDPQCVRLSKTAP